MDSNATQRMRNLRNHGLLRLFFAFQILTTIAWAEQLPVKTYTTGEGLPRDSVTLIRQDSRGFIWLAAGDGLSRFDGYKFTNYTTDDGLPDRRVNDLIETSRGIYWIATDAGLCRFNPEGLTKSARKNGKADQGKDVRTNEQMFVVYNPGDKPVTFNALKEDASGSIWSATNEGVYRVDVSPDGGVQFHFIDTGRSSGEASHRRVAALLIDRQGVLWCGVEDSIDRRLPDGRVEHYSTKNGLSHGAIISFLEDREANIWVGTQMGVKGELLKMVRAPDPSQSIVAQGYGTKGDLLAGWVNSLLQTRDGKLWAATTGGLYLFTPSIDGSPPHAQRYDDKNGLCFSLADLAEDRDGNLWVASGCGVQKIARNGFTGYGVADGLGTTSINSVLENVEGTLFVITTNHGIRIINEFDGGRFRSVEPNLESNIKYSGWGWAQTIIQDHLGDWWVPGFGLHRFSKVERLEDLAHARPQLARTLGNDYERTETFRLYEDSRGDVWMALTGQHYSLLRWDRATGKVHDHTIETGVPEKTDFTAFREDRAGNLWIGTSTGLLRYRDGKFQRYKKEDGAPDGWVTWLYLDHSGSLWIGSNLDGLKRLQDPASDSFRLTTYTTVEGLSSNNIRSITEDEWGRLYVGTGHGVDRLDLGDGSVKHFTVADGLPKGTIENAYRDRQGALWFGSVFGLSRLIPDRNQSLIRPSVYLTGLRIEGVTQAVSELGVTDLPGLDLASNQTQVSVDFIGLGASLGEELQYQYYLEGANNEWSIPSSERTINFASLAPGSYRLRVRAVGDAAHATSNPATFDFKIAAPVWRRGWFLALAFITLGLAIYSVFRFRFNQLLEVERIRTRIATDLHDDVGSGLSQVSVLSEVISRRVGQTGDVAEQLSTIGSLSRDLVDSMSDIVWAINPGRDRLSDLTHRMRRFASDVFSANGSELRFAVPLPSRDLKLGPEMRRELYLIFKEAVNNVVRHSSCTSVEITLLISDGILELSVQDNGSGFDPDNDSEGNGLANMRLRAKKLGGVLKIKSTPDGTRVDLSAPISKQRFAFPGFGRDI